MDIVRKDLLTDCDEGRRIAERLLSALRKAGYTAAIAEAVLTDCKDPTPGRRSN